MPTAFYLSDHQQSLSERSVQSELTACTSAPSFFGNKRLRLWRKMNSRSGRRPKNPEIFRRSTFSHQKTQLILPGMHEGAAAPSYLRPGLRSACPGFRFANVVCEPPAAQSAASEIRSGGMYAARTRPKWPLPLSFSGRCRRQQENDATQENEAFIFLTACRLFRHAVPRLRRRKRGCFFTPFVPSGCAAYPDSQ